MDEDLARWVIDLRREFHMHPELSGQEVRTTRRVVEILGELGLEVRRWENMTGAVGVVRGGFSGLTLALRADMDALPIDELNEVSYKSQNPGVMHACGHDAHTAIMLGVARAVASSGWRSRTKGNLVFIFQPAEERVSGAREMISRGVLEDPSVDLIMACHVAPDLPVGTLGLFSGPSHASADSFRLTVKGRGAHGGRPNEGVDPIVAAAHLVTAIQTLVSRNIKPTEPAVVTIGKFWAGSVGNVIPEVAELEGTVRALSEEVREKLLKRLEELREGMDRSFSVKSELQWLDSVPVCVNEEKISLFLQEVAADILGEERVKWLGPSMGAEDFSLFAKVRPAAIIRLGCAKQGEFQEGYAPLHSPRFDIDESCLMIGVQIFTEAAKRILLQEEGSMLVSQCPK